MERKIKYWKHWKLIYGNIRTEIHETTTNRTEIHIEQHKESQLNWKNWNSMLYTLKGRTRPHISSSYYSMYIKYTLNIYYVLDTVWMKHQGYNSERKKIKGHLLFLYYPNIISPLNYVELQYIYPKKMQSSL